jgi:hypothetical protein
VRRRGAVTWLPRRHPSFILWSRKARKLHQSERENLKKGVINTS